MHSVCWRRLLKRSRRGNAELLSEGLEYFSSSAHTTEERRKEEPSEADQTRLLTPSLPMFFKDPCSSPWEIGQHLLTNWFTNFPVYSNYTFNQSQKQAALCQGLITWMLHPNTSGNGQSNFSITSFYASCFYTLQPNSLLFKYVFLVK